MGLLRESHFFVLEIKRWQWKMLNHLPTATFFMIPLFLNSMGYDYKEISRLRVSTDINTFIHITTGSSAQDDGTAGEFTVIAGTLRKQFPVAMIYHSCPPRVISTAAKRSGEISPASAAGRNEAGDLSTQSFNRYKHNHPHNDRQPRSR